MIQRVLGKLKRASDISLLGSQILLTAVNTFQAIVGVCLKSVKRTRADRKNTFDFCPYSQGYLRLNLETVQVETYITLSDYSTI